jgi:hypothetical protein
LDFAIFDAARAGFRGPVIVVRPEREEMFRRHLREHFGPSLEPAFVHQTTPMGTGHALLSAAEHLGRPFAVANADDFYGRDSYQILFRELSVPTADNYAIVYRLGDTLSPYGGVSRAVCLVDENGFLTDITEVLDVREVSGRIAGRTASGAEVVLSGDESISMSLWGLRPEFVSALQAAYGRFRSEGTGGGELRPSDATGEFRLSDATGEFRLSDATNEIVRRNEARVKVIRVPEKGFGVTFAQDVEPTKARIEELVERGDYPTHFGEARAHTEEA